MILDLKKLRSSGKQISGFFFEYTPQVELIDIPNVAISLPVKVTGTMQLTDTHSAYVEGEVAFSLVGDCTRCLTSTTKEYAIEFNELCTVNNEDGYSVVNDKIDLSEIVNDVILINQPLSFLCKDDCLGLCGKCGKNLNEGKCDCNE